MTKRISVEIPFPGFYESRLSNALDFEEQQFAEYEANERQEENGIAPELRLNESAFHETVFDCMDYRKAHDYIAREYAASFDCVASDALGFKLRLAFEEMTSPRFYNFETDRVFASVSRYVVRRLFAMSRRDKHANLAAVIAERFTSYDGFISSYSNDLADWLAKPLMTWDHNEVGTLLRACLQIGGVDDLEDAVESHMCDSNDFYAAFEHGLDWTKFDDKIAELRADKVAEQRDSNPDYVAPAERCPFTPDMFRQP